jgi:hypothetical protein
MGHLFVLFPLPYNQRPIELNVHQASPKMKGFPYNHVYVWRIARRLWTRCTHDSNIHWWGWVHEWSSSLSTPFHKHCSRDQIAWWMVKETWDYRIESEMCEGCNSIGPSRDGSVREALLIPLDLMCEFVRLEEWDGARYQIPGVNTWILPESVLDTRYPESIHGYYQSQCWIPDTRSQYMDITL